MFIRWQKRKHDRYASFWAGQEGRSDYDDTAWSAVIVESRRVDGKPVQKHVAYLIGFTEFQAKVDAQRCHIWNAVEKKLNELSNSISPKDRQKIEAAIALKVPRPSREDQIALAKHSLERWGIVSEEQRQYLRE